MLALATDAASAIGGGRPRRVSDIMEGAGDDLRRQRSLVRLLATTVFAPLVKTGTCTSGTPCNQKTRVPAFP
jgi:hypothetical protein